MSPISSTSTYNILIDSSTKMTGGNRYGKSVACWSVFAGSLRGNPFRVGIIYCSTGGPNQMFYVGVVRALEDCFYLGHAGCQINIFGDCKTVINQLKGLWKVKALESFFSQVKGLESKYREGHRGLISYDYMGKDNSYYKKVDRCAKEALNYFEQRILNE